MSSAPSNIRPGPYADVMPDMSDEEYSALKQSIDDVGLRHPIEVTPDGIIVDGHHRYRACQELGIGPDIVVVEDATVEQAIRANFTRRNLSGGSKRDTVEWYLEHHYEGDRTQKSIAEELGVSVGTVSNAMESIQPDEYFTRDEKRQQARAYLGDNPDASNRKVAREIEADVSHPTIGSWRDEWESDADEADEDEEATVDGDDSTVSGPQSVSGPTESVSGPDSEESDDGDGEDLEEIADRGDDNVDVDVVDHGPGDEGDGETIRANDAIEALAEGAWNVKAISRAFGVSLGVAEALREACDDASGLLRVHDNLDSLDELPGVGEESAKDIKRVIPQLESEGVTKHYLPVSDDDTAEADTDDPTDGTDTGEGEGEDDLDIEDFESFDPDEYELDADTREDVEELCRDVLGDDVDSRELEGRVDELEAVLEDMVRAFENQDVQTLERVAEGRAKEVLNA